VVVPPLKSPTWLEIYNFHIQHSSGINKTTCISVGQESDGKTMGSPKKKQRTGEKSINSNNTLSTKVTVSQEMKYSVVFVSKLRHAL